MSMDGSTVVSRPTAHLTSSALQQKTNGTSNTTVVTSLAKSHNSNSNSGKSNSIRGHCDSPTNYDYSLEHEKISLDSSNLSNRIAQCTTESEYNGGGNNKPSNGTISGASSTSTIGGGEKILTNGGGDSSLTSSTTNVENATDDAGAEEPANGLPPSAGGVAAQKKRISSSRTPTRKARRVKFYRNGDRFYPGITIPVSNERYRSFESLFVDLTRLLEDNVKIPGAVRTIYSMNGKKVSTLNELEDGQSYVCSCNNEGFKKIEYNTTSQSLANMTLSSNKSNAARLSGGKVVRPASPSKNSISSGSSSTNSTNCANGTVTSVQTLFNERNSVVHPRIVTLIRNGTRPRKIMRLLLNKRNSPSFDHVLTAITQVARLDTGYVRKVFTLSGEPVTQLADFFGKSDVFFAYGTERVNNPDDFELEVGEQRALQAIRKTQGTGGTTCKGPKPKMPVKKSRNLRKIEAGDSNIATLDEVTEQSSNDSGIETTCLPASISERYSLGPIVGDGNFAVVLRIQDKKFGLPYALKIIDKSKCKGKEHYIDAEVRVMKKLQHPYIISLIMDVDMGEYMYLVLDYVGGGDLFDAITRVTRFSEDQARVMIKHLASAMAYLHSMSIVHRDIKPENLLVEVDAKGNVTELKLGDFGLACEVTEPLFAVCGTPTYVAPEILMETGYGLKIDVWAAGIILYILLCGFPPFVSLDNEQEPLFDAIIEGVYEFPDPYWSDIGDGVRDLIANMLRKEAELRFTSEDILDHYWTMNEEAAEYSS